MAHDYDPSWDYKLDPAPNPTVKGLVVRFLREHKPVFKALGLGVPEVHYVKGLRVLAKYINGTRDEPVIVMDVTRVLQTAKRYDVALDDGVESTLLHEYGHAYYDARDDHPSDEEERVEAFAHSFWEDRDVRAAMKNL